VKVEGMSQEAPKTISVPAAGRKYYGIGKNLADSDGSRPLFRDDLAHHSDLISLGIPR
jgi:hypothetical protein